ncbi:low affinity iron permease family protein [Devosia sp.]|uniref:low affinity iron permease family protein n=1 Tax=Devosia sp. TaxID=1871048 RepID=UPI002F083531
MWTKLFDDFAHTVARLSGKPVVFGLACLLVLVWAISGPLFGFSQTWQLVINTGTTIVTFLMVFVLQNSQNRDGLALQAKLDELILVSSKAENAFIAAEQLSEEEIERLRALVVDQAAADDRAPHAGRAPTVTANGTLGKA